MAAQGGHEDSEDVVLSLCAGGSLTKGQIVFSRDSKYFFCCSGSVVKVYNTTNGQCAQVLQGHRGLVTGLALNPANKLQLLSCGLDGSINVWAYMDGVLLRSHAYYMPLHALVSVDPSGASAIVIAQRPQISHCSLLRLPLKKGKAPASSQKEGADISCKTDVVIASCDSDYRTVSSGCNGRYIAAVQGLQLSIFSSSKIKKAKKLKAQNNSAFTCVSCHPTDVCIATGHNNGQITFWWNFDQDQDKTVLSVSHWHSLPVTCLAFTPQGSCLLSGGHECTLVRWQMNSEQKEFLPRLGAPLHNIVVSPDGVFFVTGHSDNVLQVISSNFNILTAIRGLAWAQLGAESLQPVPVGLVSDPRSGALVTNGRPGHLQFYSLDTDTQLYNLDIVGQNYVSPDTLHKPTTLTEVTCAAFDPNGDWLATFQSWEQADCTPEYCLKFWCYNKEQQNYQLNTTVEMPHYKTVRCLRFKPVTDSESHEPVLVSAGDDGMFKLWTLTTRTHHGKPVERWTCESVGHYRQKAATMARFSHDGTSLAVVFDSTLTLWNPDTNVLMETLSFGNDPILGVEFGGEKCANYIVFSTPSCVNVLNLSTLSVHMQVMLCQAILTTDGDLMCAVSADQDVYVFRPNEDKPVFYKKKATKDPLVSAIFLPTSGSEGSEVGWQSKSRLYVLDKKQHLFSPQLYNAHSSQTPSSRSQALLKQVLPQTPLQVLLTSAQKHEQPSSTDSHNPQFKAHNTLAGIDVMNIALTTVGPFHVFAKTLMASLLTPKKQLEEPMEEDEDRATDEDVAMVTES